MIVLFGPSAIVGFGSAGMLLWGLAAAIPILLHVWRRRHDRRMEWAAMSFLEQAVRQTARKLRMRQILLLAVRVLMLLLLAFALADPHFGGNADLAGARDRPAKYSVIVFDASYSMGVTDQNTTRFDQAKQEAREIVRRATPGDAFSLIWMGLPARTVIGRPSLDPPAVMEAIQQLTCGHGGANLEQAVQQLEALIRQARQDHSTFGACDVYWLTDLRRNTWGSARTEPLATRLRELAEEARLVIVDLAVEPDVNLVVTDLHSSDSFVVVDEDVSFVATVENPGLEPVTGVPAELWVDGQSVARRTLQLASRGQQTLEFRWRFAAPGDHRVEVRLAADSLPLDSRRALVVPVRRAMRTLCVTGSDRSASYVSMALQPDPALTKDRLVTRIAAAQFRETDVASYDAVFLCSVDAFDPAEVARLRELLSRGGGLVILLGERTQLSQYNRLLADPPPPQRILPARLVELSPRGEYRWDPREYQHPVVEPFQGHEQSGLLTTPLWRYVRLRPLPEAEIGLWFDTGDPAIVEANLARGRTLLVATPASDGAPDMRDGEFTAWNAWAVWPSFPPLILELLERAVNRLFEGRTVSVGAVMHGAAPSPPVPDSIAILREFDQTSEHLPTPTAGESWSFGATWFAGFYRIHYGSSSQADELYAVNPDPAESDPEPLAWAELDDVFLRRTGELQEDDGEQPLAQSHQPLFRWVLMLLFALLLGEAWLSWRQGRGSSREAEGVESDGMSLRTTICV